MLKKETTKLDKLISLKQAHPTYNPIKKAFGKKKARPKWKQIIKCFAPNGSKSLIVSPQVSPKSQLS